MGRTQHAHLLAFTAFERCAPPVYWVTFAAGLIVGALNVGYLAAEPLPTPIWLKVLIARLRLRGRRMRS